MVLIIEESVISIRDQVADDERFSYLIRKLGAPIPI